MLEYIKSNSPVHNVKKGFKYPATMITTGNQDDRVAPAHSFKFEAELQEKQSGENPVLQLMSRQQYKKAQKYKLSLYIIWKSMFCLKIRISKRVCKS